MPVLINDGSSPYPGRGGSTWAPTDSSSPALTREQMDTLSMQIYRKANQTDLGVGAYEHIARFTLGAGIDLADTVYSSPLNPFGSRGDVWKMASPDEQDYYKRHQPMIEATSAIAGGVLTMVASEALLIPRLSAAMASSTALTGTRLWKAAETWNVASRARMLAAQRGAAEAGESYGLLANPGGRLLAMTPGRSFALNQTLAGAAAATRTAPIEYAVMWNNDAFNSGDWSREGFWIGVGAAVGGTVGGIGARAFARMSANSDEIRNLRGTPFAMAGVSNDLLSSEHVRIAPTIDPRMIENKESAYTTSFLTASRSANPKGDSEAAANATRLHFLRNEYANLATDSAQKIVSKGIDGVDTIKASIKDLPEVQHLIQEVGKDDPFILHGLATMGVLRDGSIKTARESRTNYLESLTKQAEIAAKRNKPKEAQRLNRLVKVLGEQDEFVMVNGAWMNPDSELAKAAVAHDPKGVLARTMTQSQITEAMTIQTSTGQKMLLDMGLEVQDANHRAVNVGKLKLRERFALDEASNVLVKKLAKRGKNSPEGRVKLTDTSAGNWYALDLAAEIMRRNPEAVEIATKGNKNVPALSSLADIERQSLRLKAKAVIMEVQSLGKITPELRFKYNLPAPTAMELIEDPAGDSFKQWLARAMSTEGTSRDFADALSDSRSLAGIDLIDNHAGDPLRIDGNMFGFNRTTQEKGSQWLRPLMGYFDKRNRIQKIAEAGHSAAITQRRAERTAILMSSKTHVSALANELVNMPELDTAMNVAGLNADQITGIGGGLRQAFGEILPTRFRHRDNKTLLAASKLQETAERHGTAMYRIRTGPSVDGNGTVIPGAVDMQSTVTRVTSAGNAHKMVMLDQYASLRGGWDIKQPKDLGDGFYAFELKDTAQNRERLGMTKNEKWQPRNMPNPNVGKDIVVDGDGLEALGKFEKLSKELWLSDNVIRSSRGEQPIQYRDFFWPSPQTKGALVGYVLGPDNQLVVGRTIVARSQEEYDNLARKTLEHYGNSSGFTIRTRESLESLRDIWDEAGMDWINPGISAATAGIGSQKGGLSGAYIKQGAFMEGLDWVKRKMVAQSQDTLRQIMHEPLLVARANGAVEAAASPTAGRTVFDEYERALTGKSQNFTDTSIIDGVLRGAEDRVNKMLANTAIATKATHVVDLGQRLGMNPRDFHGIRTYNDIAKKMGPYTPYNNAVEYLETRGIKRPPTVRGMATKLNTLAAGVLLRWLEVPHAAVNLMGLIATVPPAIMAGRAPISTFMNVRGEHIGVIDSMKIMSDAMSDMWRKRGSADWLHMKKTGDASQSVIDYHKALTSADSQAGFNGFMKGADKWASILTDTSESWSRQFAHFVGLRMADYHGLTGMAARHDFAREIANSAIADYAPINRPELFQSGFGSMLGLFQSYALNHYNKMFRWMETKDYKSAGTAAAIQATMFGLPGTYGLGTLMDLRDSMTSSGSEPTALDLIYQQFGPVLGGAIAHGSISQVSGLALWSRGEMNFRIPGAQGQLPALDIGTKVARGFVDATSAFMNAMPGEGRHAILEAVQRDMPSRVMRSWLTLLNSGQEIDTYGQVMSDTTGWLDTVARTIGVRSTRQQAELEAFYQGKGAMQRDAAKMDKLRESFRAAVRHNSGDPSAVSPIQYFNDYVAAGGNPAMFKTWVKTLMRDSDSVRTASQLRKQLTTQRSALETWRYGAYGAWNVMD